MYRKQILLLFCLLISEISFSQTTQFADSIRKVYRIPELGYAVVSSAGIIELNVIGMKKINTSLLADTNDKFRIGSNTKAITGFIAAQLVKQNKISWHSKFFDLFPELKAKSNAAYYNLTLLNLLSFRTRLFSYTYTYAEPKREQFPGNEAEQRYQFITWFFKHKPVSDTNNFQFSNLGYVAAALMLEKVSGKSYKELVTGLGNQLGIKFGFGTPNAIDSLQPCGYDENLNPEKTNNDYKLNWLLAAGNINVSLPDYAKFIQLQLQGLSGHSTLLSKEEFTFLHFGLPQFSVGWFSATDENDQTYSYNIGNPGTFLTKVFVYNNADRAYILFANSQTENTDTGLNILLEELKKKYGK